MPLFYQHSINQGTKLGIWKIEEGEDFFLEKVPLQREISHPHKRLQHLAGRYLMQYLFPGFPYALIRLADTRKPFLINDAYHFSISHSGDFAAVIVSTGNRVGMDIELVKPMIRRISNKFLSVDELMILDEKYPEYLSPGEVSSANKDEVLTLCWCAKEAIFKWFGEGGVDFKKHILIDTTFHHMHEGWVVCTFCKSDAFTVAVHFRRFENMVFAWLVTDK